MIAAAKKGPGAVTYGTTGIGSDDHIIWLLFETAAGLPEQARLWEHVRATPVAQVQVTSDRGNPGQAIAGAAKTLSASYDFAIHTHGSMGPSCAVAAFEEVVTGAAAEGIVPGSSDHRARKAGEITD